MASAAKKTLFSSLGFGRFQLLTNQAPDGDTGVTRRLF